MKVENLRKQMKDKEFKFFFTTSAVGFAVVDDVFEMNNEIYFKVTGTGGFRLVYLLQKGRQYIIPMRNITRFRRG